MKQSEKLCIYFMLHLRSIHKQEIHSTYFVMDSSDESEAYCHNIIHTDETYFSFTFKSLDFQIPAVHTRKVTRSDFALRSS
jgi:hypothetical protein